MTDKPPVFHQHVVVDLVNLEKKQWEAISESHGEMTTEFTRRWHICGENFPFPEAAPIVFVILQKINQHTLLNNTL